MTIDMIKEAFEEWENYEHPTKEHVDFAYSLYSIEGYIAPLYFYACYMAALEDRGGV